MGAFAVMNGVFAEDVAALLLNVLTPSEFEDGGGNTLTLMLDAVDAAKYTLAWRRLVAAGFDLTTPFMSKGAALKAVRDWADSNPEALKHADLKLKADNTLKMGTREGPGVNHFPKNYLRSPGRKTVTDKDL